ncbi:MAG TPA: hypothetical protein VMA98_10325 [Candidatus Acidoferrales bacterium]|nr:hypothetical protein [Candidatus Acidoferrales bacterium]
MLFFAGPAHAGQSFTYRVTTTLSTQASPAVSTLVLTWAAPARIYARISGDGSAPAIDITRAGDGTLSVTASAASGSADAGAIATLLAQLDFPASVATKLDGSDHGQFVMNVSPPTAPAPQKSPAPVAVPLNVDLISTANSATLIADGNSTRRDTDSSSWRRGGGWRSRDADSSREDSSQPAGIALEAVFDQSGSLEHATFRETFPSPTKGAQPIEKTLTIERIAT